MSGILIAGGGFAGMWAALVAARERHQANASFPITLVSRDEYLTIRPRLYEKNPQSLRTSIADTLATVNVEVVTGDITSINTQAQSISVEGSRGTEDLPYERLVLATGSHLRPLPITGADEFAWNVDSFEAAVKLDDHLASVSKENTQAANTFVIIGAGFTGIELALELRDRITAHANKEIAHQARIVLADRSDRVGKDLGDKPAEEIQNAIHEARIETRLNCSVEKISADSLTLDNGETIESRTVIVTSGMIASPLTQQLQGEKDALDRITVDEFLHAKSHENIFVCGDVASAYVDSDHKALMSCQHAMPMGKHAGYNAARELLELELRAYRQPDYVTCLDLGRSGAVFTRGWDREVQMTGEEAGELKRKINRLWIYPPTGNREEILEQSNIDAPSRRSQVE